MPSDPLSLHGDRTDDRVELGGHAHASDLGEVGDAAGDLSSEVPKLTPEEQHREDDHDRPDEHLEVLKHELRNVHAETVQRIFALPKPQPGSLLG